jgi:arylsulfatase A-like enzyme
MLLTGQETHRLGSAANLYGPLQASVPTYVSLLEKAGYFVGYSGKGWAPGSPADGGYSANPAGRQFPSFQAFLKAKPADKPFCFWFGPHDPHVPWDRGVAFRSQMDLAKIPVPPHLPDHPSVREDIRAYYAEVQQFDTECGEHLRLLEQAGQLDQTLIAMTGDNGWQMPRGLAGCYDLGVRVPLAVRYPKAFKAGTRHEGFVTLGDLCPTFLTAAAVPVPSQVTGKSLLKPPQRDAVFLERERHANVRRGDLTYPVRGIRTRDFLYLRNLAPDRWPAGDPEHYWAVGEYGDIDESPSKRLIMKTKQEPYFSLSFGKRPAEELYDLKADPGQTRNVATDPKLAQVKAKLSARVDAWMRDTNDPRARTPHTDLWDKVPYSGRKGRQGQPAVQKGK